MKKITFIILILLLFVISSSCIIDNPSNQNNKENIASSPPVPDMSENSTPKLSYEERMINNMSLDEKIGQLVILGFSEGTTDEELKKLIQVNKVGGFILFRRNYSNFRELYELNSKLKNYNKENKLPLFIAIDEEGGTVSRIPKEGITMPDARIFGQIDDLSLTEKSGRIIGKQLYSAGVNMNFAPVLDILSRNDNTLLKNRSYGNNANKVSSHGLSYIKGINEEGIISVPKHFPGHGHTNTDSHASLPIINIDLDTLNNRELVPFRNAINADIDAMMIGHLSFPKIDESGKPASRSKVFLTDILRNQLGFKGIAISDDLEMAGFVKGKESLEDAVIESFNAGMDIFVICHTKEMQYRVLEALRKGLSKGLISEDRINQTLERIIKVKTKYTLSNEMNLQYDEAFDLFIDSEYRDFINSTRKAFTESTN
ncbi:beta-N-acetylhexosaminidase [Lutispora thermophila]|uniref:beta-N-acetylhexosaminidase n=1 Tax=Lutispora thermophila DSM 19022 TaxID=1122184 RepID=A0A1M6EWC8_9FIRM|nr:beta-N-acetylhexosaminidase [Lutispora thermophila]SHI89746.1 beta-N-acetylhexosaminidase [Lutispora thermophila DSM 19022]